MKLKEVNSGGVPFFERDPLHWALVRLVIDNPEDPENSLDPTIVYSILDDHLTNSSSTERGRISDRLYKTIANTAALQEILSAIRLKRPLSVCRNFDSCYATEVRASWKFMQQFNKLKKNPAIGDKNLFAAFPAKMTELARLIKAFEAVPLPVVGRPDQSWVQSFEDRHAALNAFWDQGRSMWRKYAGLYRTPSAEVEEFLTILQADSKPEHLKALREEKAKLLARIAGQSIASKPTRSIQTEWAHHETDSVIASVRNKKKSRPEDAQPSIPQQEMRAHLEDLCLTEPPAAVKITVKQQTFNVLSAMFRVDVRKDYEWDAFVAAMNEAGFPATHTATGSAVSFEADESICAWKGKINFHKPHPVAKIDAILLHAMGKRMKKWSGWNESTFEVVAKQA